MKRIGHELHSTTGVFTIRAPLAGPPKILDMCMAPGAYLSVAMELNPRADACAFTLSPEIGGHKSFLPRGWKTDVEFMDITMLAADMGVRAVPPEHPDADNFLPRRFQPHDVFDLVICDGHVVTRTY